MMWRRLDSRVVAILSAEWVGGGVPVQPEASYAVASLRQSCCYSTYSVRSGRVGVPLEPEASYASCCHSTQCGEGGWVRSF